ncbi:septum site-determining protein MinC [Synechococcus sp. CS-1325]|uniref:septum site-determining protein MinC n=1 Tax=unclassified Synechococcus TaxID=2626047 RepID=UPI000DB423DE|nr:MULTISPECIES: septum site-determining protein MinC [unclassified Synechococcus]MCT0198863.1 septum site-determining protein MinC [Synechococcus sp. CS-1325]MCT0214045.1 septum site-determining protein MinC [Synechococcus sp. CS-1326]MCT0234132.1 septum site-determining protein MinC [Synechococcus sp. CS-1327]PZV00041.1 MAG: septum site-determining protein MinC [Cyanobium sp.]
MAAVFIRAERSGLPHQLLLPQRANRTGSALEEVIHGLGSRPPSGPVVLHSGDWPLTLPALRELQGHLSERSLELIEVNSRIETTLVGAAALGLYTRTSPSPADGPAEEQDNLNRLDEARLTIHRGTLRSGDHMTVEGSVLVLGDVNPGARVSAVGHVLILGRLRGIAHAGCRGDGEARIVALELRPLQLRIGKAVARGPADPPPAGFTEQARLVDGQILIEPAPPLWPLGR